MAREASPAIDAPKLRAPSRSGVMLGALVGAVAVSGALLGSACAAYGGPVYANDAGADSARPDGGAPDAP